MENRVLDTILSLTNIPDDQQSQELAELGVKTLLTKLVDEPNITDIRVDKSYVETLIAEIDSRLSQQLDTILHTDEFRQLERPWRSLKFLVNRTDFNENIKISIMSVSKDELLDDFDDSTDITESGLYRKIFTDEFGQYGGEPFGVIIGDYEISPSNEDIRFLSNMAEVSAINHSPFISAVNEAFLNVEDFAELPKIKQVEAVFEGPQYSAWRKFRDSEDARNVGLTLPRFMLRSTYGDDLPVRTFDYVEDITATDDYLWGNAAFAYATRLTESFANYRWCPNIIGPQSGGSVNDLPIDVVDVHGSEIAVGPVQAPISDRKEFELSELGFIPLTLRKDSDCAVFFSSNSTQRPKQFAKDEEGKQAELNFKLGTQLPYLFIINRLAHYIKALQRENLGSWKNKTDLEAELNKWIRQYVADQENPSAATRSQRPLRKASLTVNAVEDDAGWFRVNLEVTPHFKFMGANFTLSLTSLLDRV